MLGVTAALLLLLSLFKCLTGGWLVRGSHAAASIFILTSLAFAIEFAKVGVVLLQRDVFLIAGRNSKVFLRIPPQSLMEWIGLETKCRRCRIIISG